MWNARERGVASACTMFGIVFTEFSTDWFAVYATAPFMGPGESISTRFEYSVETGVSQ